MSKWRKETSINRPSNIYCIIDRIEVGLPRKAGGGGGAGNDYLGFLTQCMQVYSFLSIFLINSCFPSGRCTLVKTQQANRGFLTAIYEPVNV